MSRFVSIRHVSVRNFRCLKEVDIDFSGLVALIGPNGSGKSTFLHALRFFFGNLDIDDRDCWGGDPDLTVEVAVKIEIRTDDPELSPFLDDAQTLWVARRSESSDGHRSESLVSRRRGNPDFTNVRAATKATPAKFAYKELREGAYGELPSWTNFGALAGALQAWEEEYVEHLEWVEDRSVGFGVGAVDLARYLEPVFVPAVRDAAADSETGKTSLLRTLIERVVNPQALFADTAVDLDHEFRERYDEMIAGAGDSLGQAATTISGRLNRFAPGAAVSLEWDGSPPSVVAPGVRAHLVEGGHAAEIGHQGHGVQRAYILALLHELAVGSSDSDEPRPVLFMMIEEPELYQHPTRSRLLARILADLATSEDSRTQVLYATHSPHFVGLDRIESLRVLRLGPGSGHPSTVSASVDLTCVAAKLWSAGGEEGDPFTAATLAPRLRTLGQAPVADGFFADGVVLVEGEEDRAFLLAAAQDSDLDFDILNVAIIPVGGKTNLDRPLLVFRALGIPVFTVFDGDSHIRQGQIAANEKINSRLLSLLQAEPARKPPTQVCTEWACFEETLERTVRQEVGDDLWEMSLRAAADAVGYLRVRDAKKNPTVLLDAYQRLRLEGGRSVTLDALVAAIRSKFAA